MSTAKNAILKAKIEGVVYEIMTKTTAENVYVDSSTTLAAKLASLIADIATKADAQAMTDALAGKAAAEHNHEMGEVNGLTEEIAKLATTTALTEAINGLRQEMLGDTPVEAYNTFTELAQYIETHGEAAEALEAAVGNKADKATTLEGYGIGDAYTKTEVDTKIANAVKDATGGESAASVKALLEAYQTSNDARVKAIEDDYLKDADKTELSGAISDGDATTLSQAKTYADGKASTAESNAKAYADGLAVNYDAKGSAATAESNAKAYAKEYADGLDTAMGTRVGAVETAVADKGRVYYSATEPANLSDKDLWVQLI